jgi:hypothetical protein
MEQIVDALLGRFVRGRAPQSGSRTLNALPAPHVMQKYLPAQRVSLHYRPHRKSATDLTAMFLALVFGPWLIRNFVNCRLANLSAKKVRKRTRKKPARPPWAVS